MQRIGEDGDAVGQQPAEDLQHCKSQIEEKSNLDIARCRMGMRVIMMM